MDAELLKAGDVGTTSRTPSIARDLSVTSAANTLSWQHT